MLFSKKNILFINPRENQRTYPEPYPSGAFVLMGTMAHNLGHNVKIVHMGVDKVEANDIAKAVKEFKPDIIGISINTFQTRDAKEIIKIIKETNQNTLLTVGGPHVSGMGTRIFNDFPNIDIAIFGEGEHTFLEIVAGKGLSKIKGLAYKDGEEVRINTPRLPAMNLDYIPLPNLDLVSFSKERFRGIDPVIALPSMYIMASRGCPFQCIYCNKSVWGFKTRFRKPELIIRELEWLRDRYGVKEIFFQDDTLNLSRKWITKLLNLIIQHGLNKDMAYKVDLRANKHLIDRELLKLLKKANVQYIFYGVESGNQEMLNRMKKGLTIEELKRAFSLTHSVGIKTIASFIIGLPGETEETINDTIKLSKELSPFAAGFVLATPLPGTEFEKILLEKGHLLDRDYDHYSFGYGVVRTDKLTKEQLEYHRMRITNRKEFKILKKNLRHPITNKSYFINKIKNILRSPKSLIRRLKTIIS